MKNIIFITIVCLAFASCGKPKAPKSLPVEKVYIMEFDFVHQGWDGDTEESLWGIEMLGLAELKNDFTLKITKETEPHSDRYFETEFSMAEDQRSEINRIIRENQKNTTYIDEYERNENILDDRCQYPGSYYQIIIERKFYENTSIIFDKRLLSEDLRTLFDQLYANPMQHKWGSDYKSFVGKVEKETLKSLKKYNLLKVLPPPVLRETVKYIPPVIVEDPVIETDYGYEIE